MRMFITDRSPSPDLTWMCRKHLLGNHVESHMATRSLDLGKHIHKYVRTTSVQPSGRPLDGNCLEPLNLDWWHDAIAAEMLRRGMNHRSPLDFDPDRWTHLTEHELYAKIDEESALWDLLDRCSDCRANYNVSFHRKIV